MADRATLRDLTPTFKPIVKRLWVEPTGSGQGGGFAFFEFSPAGLRWWWEHEPETAESISPSQITDSAFIRRAEVIEEQIVMSRVRLQEARRLLATADSLPGLRLLVAPDARIDLCETCGGDGAMLSPAAPHQENR